MNGDNPIFSNYYRVLEILFDNQVTANGITFCAITQMEMAKILNCDRMTINPIMKKLQDDNLVIKTTSKTKQYQLTEKAIKLVKQIKKIID